MSTEQIWQTVSTSSSETLLLGEQIGRKLRGGEVIELQGDLGSGKTTFVKGLAAGMGSSDVVTSPSFTITNEYKASNKILYHHDFYRLTDGSLIENQLAEIMADKQAVTVIEWPGVLDYQRPQKYLVIKITPKGEDIREFKFESYGLEHLIN